MAMIYHMVVTPEQAQWWLDKSGMTVDIDEVDRLTLKVLEGELEPTPAISIRDGKVFRQYDANRLAAISTIVNINGFPPIEMDVEFLTSLPDVKEMIEVDG